VRAFECEFEAEVLLAVRRGRFPSQAEEISAHAASCPVCSGVVAAASAFENASEELLARAELPDAGQVWRRAQLRARREAVEAAGRPITAVQVIAFAAAMGLIGACFGATSGWFQSGLRWVVSQWKAMDQAAWLASSLAFVSEHSAIVLTVLGFVFLLPAAVHFVLCRD
jgi:hypothetical protein